MVILSLRKLKPIFSLSWDTALTSRQTAHVKCRYVLKFLWNYSTASNKKARLMGSAEAIQRKPHTVLVVKVLPDWGKTRLWATYTFNSHPSLTHHNLVACLHSTITAVMGLAEMNGAWAGRHILPFMTETYFVHKTNGESQ